MLLQQTMRLISEHTYMTFTEEKILPEKIIARICTPFHYGKSNVSGHGIYET